MKYKLRFRWRGFKWAVRRNWYSLYRWNNEQEYMGHYWRILDVGAFSISVRWKE